MSHDHPHGAGKSSYDLIDQARFWDLLPLEGVGAALDLGCGRGNYTLELARRLPAGATVYALDLWREGLKELERRAAEEGRKGIVTLHADAGRRLPLEEASLDLCLLGTVYHDLAEDGRHQGATAEMHRALRPGATLALVEFLKIEGPPGPPLAIRLSHQDLEAMLGPQGFTPLSTHGVGPYHYLSLFKRD